MSAVRLASPLADPAPIIKRIFATTFRPPPEIDFAAWAQDNIRFGAESPLPGPYRLDKFPFFRRIFEVLGPDDRARVVTLMKSAQLGATTLGQVWITAAMELDPGNSLYVHVTEDNAKRWVRTKFRPMLKASHLIPSLFADQKSRDSSSTLLHHDRADGRGSLIVSGASSEASLSMITVSRQVQDDIDKFDLNDAGDPEAQADSRSKAMMFAKIFKNATPLTEDNSRINRHFKNGSQEYWTMPCPGCDADMVFDPYDLIRSCDAQGTNPDPDQAHFTCSQCGQIVDDRNRSQMVQAGRWVAKNPNAREPSFYLWSAYSPLESLSAIAARWIAAKGSPAREQTWFNDDAGLPYQTAGESPAWEGLLQRATESDYAKGQIPPGALILTAGVDFQKDRIEVHVMGFGEDDRRWTIDYEIIDGGIETERARAALDAYIKRRWPDQFGNYRGLDLVAADGNTWTPEIVAWARPHPGRVMVIRTAQSDSALPLAAPRGSEIRGKDGKPVKRTRYFLVGASQIKSVLYKSLAITDPNARAYIAFPRGLDDEFFRQLTAEKRKPEKRKDGFIKWSWVKTYERNEVLDTAVYAEAAAIRRGWRRFNSAQWAQLRTFLEHPNTNSAQPTLFDPDIAQIAGQAVAPAAITPPPEAVTQAQMPVPQPAHRAQSRRRFYQGNA